MKRFLNVKWLSLCMAFVLLISLAACTYAGPAPDRISSSAETTTEALESKQEETSQNSETSIIEQTAPQENTTESTKAEETTESVPEETTEPETSSVPETTTEKPSATQTPTTTQAPSVTQAPSTTAASTSATVPETTSGSSNSGAMDTSISSIQLVKNMKTGWNLGNSLDATECTWVSNELDYESAWCQAKASKELINAVYKAGFNTIRVPVSWHNHMDSKGNISSAWMNRVKEVVDYAYNKGMYVILDVHHDVEPDYYYPSSDKLAQSTKFMKNVWTQIAKTFKNYNEHLIFEGINEPRMKGHTNEWWFNSGSADCVDSLKCIVTLNQVFVDTVRATGGNNAYRFLMVGGYDTDYFTTVTSAFSLPKDSAKDRLIVTAHMYYDYGFAGDASGTNVFDDASKNSILNGCKSLYNTYVSKGIGVVIGEYGAIDKNNLSEREKYYTYQVKTAKDYGICCVVWDNNAGLEKKNSYSSKDFDNKYQIFDRKTGKIMQPNIVTAIMKGLK